MYRRQTPCYTHKHCCVKCKVQRYPLHPHTRVCLNRHLLDTLQLPSSPPCPSRPLKHQIQYIMFAIGPIESSPPLVNELVLREPAGNEGPAVAGLHFCWFAIHFPQFSCALIGNYISQRASLCGPTQSSFHESLLFAVTTKEQQSAHVKI